MPSIANILNDSVKGKYFRHIGTGMVIEASEIVYPNDEISPNEKFLLATNPLTGESLSISYEDTANYLTLSETEAINLRNHLRGHSERLSRIARSVDEQYLLLP